MANCRQCGAELPAFTFGELSPYCKACREQNLPETKPATESSLALLGPGSTRWVTATNALIAINVAVFLGMVISGVSLINPKTDDLLRWGADYGPDTLSGQYWRIVTSAFVHIGIIHILLNMWCLWSLGRLLERLLGALATFSIYVLTGAGSALLSLSWNPMRVSAGASGAIFGIAGVLIPVLYYGKLNMPPENVRKLLGYVVRFSLINLLYGLSGRIDNMAHLGGLITGLVAGLFLARSFALPAEDRAAQRKTVLALTSLAVALLVIPVAKAKHYAAEWHEGQSSLDREDYNSAIEHLRKYSAAQPDDPHGHALLGSALQQAERYDEAAREYEAGLQLLPGDLFMQANLATIYLQRVNLAKIYLQQDKPEKAVNLFQAGVRGGAKDDKDSLYWYAQALKAAGNLEEAEKVVRQAISVDDKDPISKELLAEILDAQGKTGQAHPEKERKGHAKRKNAGTTSPESQ